MTASDAEAFHRAAVERWKQEPDAIEKLVIKLGWLHLEKAEAILRAKAVEAERDAAEQRAQAAEAREDALRDDLRYLRRGCLNLGGTTCRLCLGTWIAADGERSEDHHDGCPMRATAGCALLRAAEGGEG